MKGPWELYDELIDEIPNELMVDHYAIGLGWTQVWSKDQTGVALTVRQKGPRILSHGNYKGLPLKDVAALIKSWDFIEASVGAAALNCYYNTFHKVKAQGGFKDIVFEDLTHKERVKKEAFIAFRNEITGKKVAIIGHFPHIEKELGPICDLSILERNPQKGDYPDSACEYILPEQDYLFITGMTLTNKTLPRLLALAKDNAKTSIVGPSICLSPKLLQWGADNLSGFCVLDRDMLNEVVLGAEKSAIFRSGVMVSIGGE